mmetsp:Transcript_62348/g.136250  ORF Transcript_62348/g.136250 Transcript_62348/m.136250 type:complete len:145 (+) Transcript_62348:706-1140(+)
MATPSRPFRMWLSAEIFPRGKPDPGSTQCADTLPCHSGCRWGGTGGPVGAAMAAMAPSTTFGGGQACTRSASSSSSSTMMSVSALVLITSAAVEEEQAREIQSHKVRDDRERKGTIGAHGVLCCLEELARIHEWVPLDTKIQLK